MTSEDAKREFVNEEVCTLQKIIHICRVFDFKMNTHTKPSGELDYIEFGDSTLWLHHKTGYYTGKRIKSGKINIVWGLVFTNFFDRGGYAGNPDPTDVEMLTHNIDTAISYMENDAVFWACGHRKPVLRGILPKIKEIISEEHFPEIPEDLKGLAYTMEPEDFPEHFVVWEDAEGNIHKQTEETPAPEGVKWWTVPEDQLKEVLTQ